MNPEQLPNSPPFSRLPEVGEPRHDPPPEEQLAAVTRCAISVYSPARHCPDYLALLGTEMTQRERRFTPRGEVASLWFRGHPLRQLAAEELTQLVFHLGNRFNLHHDRGCERGIQLGPEHCTRDNLALLKGLGFDVVRIVLDATLASADSGINPFRRAVGTVREFAGVRLQANVSYGAATNEDYLLKAVDILIAAVAEDIDLEVCLPPASRGSHQDQCRALFLHSEQLLSDAGYQLFGDRSFKNHGHPHRSLRDNQRLAYGPWGFYSDDIHQWLGLGLDAEGLLDGFFYRNTRNEEDYRARLEARRATEVSWSTMAIDQQPLYRLIQQLFCYHRVTDPTLLPHATRQHLADKAWLHWDGTHMHLTPKGIHNLPFLIHEIIQRAADDRN